MNQDEAGISEVADQTLIIALGLVLAVVAAVLILSAFVPVNKTAYLVPQFGVGNASGSIVITIFSRGGEPIDFNTSSQARYMGVLYVDTPEGSFKAAPVPGLPVFRPGETFYAYYTGSGFVLTDSLADVTFPSLPGGKITVRLVDATSDVLISGADLIVAGPSPAPTTTGIPTTTVTIPVTTTGTGTMTATPTATGTATANATPTATVTTPLPPLAANFNWAEAGASGNVRFTDTSTGTPTSWSWNFGDGATSANRHPVHRYTTGASYDVSLTVTRISDGATSAITKRITV